ncbi:MAG: hypothetical protein LW710_12510 [Burkholderiales bacterium]|uniref:hypothetical protein n=1 Tax=Limnobacter sp. TaxID=2003368 RepID=UPI0039605F8A|nr:hypothetical protein [Burkholderiales bacterium]
MTNPNIATASCVKTSTTVVKSLARGLLEASPGQASISNYVNVKFGAGQKPTHAQSMWLGLRKITHHMEVIEQSAIKANRSLSVRDCERAARRSMEYLGHLLKCLTEEEQSHPSFRKELIEHLENMIRWYPNTPRVWIMAQKSLRMGEHITYKERRFDRHRCAFMARDILEAIQRERFRLARSAKSTGQR